MVNTNFNSKGLRLQHYICTNVTRWEKRTMLCIHDSRPILHHLNTHSHSTTQKKWVSLETIRRHHGRTCFSNPGLGVEFQCSGLFSVWTAWQWLDALSAWERGRRIWALCSPLSCFRATDYTNCLCVCVLSPRYPCLEELCLENI